MRDYGEPRRVPQADRRFLLHVAELRRQEIRAREDAGEVVPETAPRASGRPRGLEREQVVAIRERYAAGESPRALAREFGVDPGVLFPLVRGRTYRDVGGPISGARAGKPALTEEEVETVRARSESGESNSALARDFGVDRNTIRSIVQGKSYLNASRLRGTLRAEGLLEGGS